MKVQVLVDNPNSWIIKYAEKLVNTLNSLEIEATLLFNHSNVSEGDILCLLSCEKKFTSLKLNKFILVVHESDLPQEKGWLPHTWQVLEGKNRIPICLFEATDKIDAGSIYYKDYIELNRNEFVDELKEKQGKRIIEFVTEFVNQYPNINNFINFLRYKFFDNTNYNDGDLDVNNKNHINLREVTKDDIKLLYIWVNDFNVRQNAINPNKILWENHNKWFFEKLHDDNCHIFIAVINNVPIGQVRFEFNNGYYKIDYSIDKKYRGKGFGYVMLKNAIYNLIIKKHTVLRFYGEVKYNNISSLKVFNKLGFEYKQNNDIYVFEKVFQPNAFF